MKRHPIYHANANEEGVTSLHIKPSIEEEGELREQGKKSQSTLSGLTFFISHNIMPVQIGIEEHQRSYLYLLIDQLNKENFTHVGFWKVYQLREMACNSCCKFQKFKFPFHMHPSPPLLYCAVHQASNLQPLPFRQNKLGKERQIQFRK